MGHDINRRIPAKIFLINGKEGERPSSKRLSQKDRQQLSTEDIRAIRTSMYGKKKVFALSSGLRKRQQKKYS
jgi:hypothetical protein